MTIPLQFIPVNRVIKIVRKGTPLQIFVSHAKLCESVVRKGSNFLFGHI